MHPAQAEALPREGASALDSCIVSQQVDCVVNIHEMNAVNDNCEQLLLQCKVQPQFLTVHCPVDSGLAAHA